MSVYTETEVMNKFCKEPDAGKLQVRICGGKASQGTCLPDNYRVVKTGILYSYQSRYINPPDDFNFEKERFRNLKSDTECEGLARALAKMTIGRKKHCNRYPAV